MPEIYFPHLGISINELNRAAITIGDFNVYWYGIIIASAILLGYIGVGLTLKKQGRSLDEYTTYLIIVILVSILCARTYYVIFSWSYYSNYPMEILNFRNGGLGIYGGVLGAIITTIVYCKVTKKSFREMADLFSPFLILGQAIGRWGNFFNKEAFGGITDTLFSMALRCDTIRYIPESLIGKTVNYFGTEYLQVHPTFFYESMCSFVIFGYLIYKYHHKHFKGEVFYSYIILYSFARFFIEGLRTDQLLIGNIPISQIVATCLFLTGIILYLKEKFANRKKDAKKV
ncbi:MAG: prolipoprotein diacylglyceryl transferase [Clostridia bacterium]|nr:prolipoprotein diacylglyceryl transferase [Clostridia bacterium]